MPILRIKRLCAIGGVLVTLLMVAGCSFDKLSIENGKFNPRSSGMEGSIPDTSVPLSGSDGSVREEDQAITPVVASVLDCRE